MSDKVHEATLVKDLGSEIRGRFKQTKLDWMEKRGYASTVSPVSYELIEKICNVIINKGVTMSKLCEKKMLGPNTPSYATIYRWMRMEPEIREMIDFAREAHAEAQADRAIDLLEDVDLDAHPKELDRVKEVVKAIQWRAEKLSKRYSAKQTLVTEDAEGNSQPVQIAFLPPLALGPGDE